MKIKQYLLVITLLLTTGCGTMGSNIDSSFSPGDLGADGLVFLSTTTEPDDSRYPIFVDLNISSIGASNPYAQVRTHSDDAWGAPDSDFEDAFGNVAVLRVPDGDYYVSRWVVNDGFKQIFYSPDVPLEFSVSAGEATYIGNFNFHPATSKNMFSINLVFGGNAEFRDRHEQDIPAIYRNFPNLEGIRVNQSVFEPY